MKRKQVTYARKRRTRCQTPAATNSSPLQDIVDPEQQISHSEMSRRMLKRARRSGSGTGTAAASRFQGRNPKKLKISPQEGQELVDKIPESFAYNHDYDDVQTPHPTLLTESQRFQLESSKGLPLSPDHEFSPVPLAPNPLPGRYPKLGLTEASPRQNAALRRQTSSSNLKENATRPPSKPHPKISVAITDQAFPDSQRLVKSKLKHAGLELPLASPFTSKPTSPHVSPGISLPPDNAIHSRPKGTKIGAMKVKRTLSDTHYNPNLPTPVQKKAYVQSAVSSPTRAEAETIKLRRPSAPSAIAHRPDVASWFVSSNIPTGTKSHTTAPNFHDDATDRMSGVDFNRPPSQLSYTSTYDEDFFGDALGISTPFGLKSLAAGQAVLFRSGGDPLDSTDSESDEEFGGGWLKPTLHSFTGPGTVAKIPVSVPIESLWLSDSIISPPTALLERAYSKSSPAFVDAHVSLGNGAAEDTLGLGSPFGLGHALEIIDGNKTERAEELKELLESLDINFESCPRPNISRARSLDLEQYAVPTLCSPAHISPTKAKNINGNTNTRGGRDRRGTIRASDFQSKQSTETGMVEGGGGARRTRSGTIIGPARRDRSGTIVARPPNLTMSHRNDMDVDLQNTADLPGDVRDDALMTEVDEFEDELLLKGHWHDEDWVVADNPSPVVPRRNIAKKRDQGWRIEWERNKNRERRQRKLGISTGNWGMIEHDENDGEGDLLDLLK